MKITINTKFEMGDIVYSSINDRLYKICKFLRYDAEGMIKYKVSGIANSECLSQGMHQEATLILFALLPQEFPGYNRLAEQAEVIEKLFEKEGMKD